ncbi:hypothetical protein [Acetonema longum]|uniref:Putative prophage LambdaCh01, repressor protein n=1 Tax=Acetonema longum DSM 6540 TaxID=1009370 RepID=F7NLM2_9FIRM|nr:hypothetical protein [Acetonema longum]EGO63044.1 putative prophage LambdaCh01, repressor protein [Acetonema longum DSM 6540]
MRKNGQAGLRSANPVFRDILLTPQHHIDGVVVALLKKQVPALADYERLLDHKHLLDAIWSEIAALAGKNGIPAEFVKRLIEVQVAMAGKRS